MNILCICCFACFNTNDLNHLLNCKNTFLQNLYSIHCKLVIFTGFFESVDLKNKFTESFPKCWKLIVAENNVGKSKLFNNVVNIYKYDQDWLIYFDGDIDFSITNNNVFQDLVDGYYFLNSFFNCGLIVLNQQDDVRHNGVVFSEKYSQKYIIGDNIFLKPSITDLLAFGCFFCKLNIFYNQSLPFVGSYGPEDTLFARMLKQKNIHCCLAKNLFVTHPWKFI